MLMNCKRCGHEWRPRVEGHPVQCPKCKSPYWDREKRNEVRTDSKPEHDDVGILRSSTKSGGARPLGKPVQNSSELQRDELGARSGVGKFPSNVGDSTLDVEYGRKFPSLPCPRCRRTLTDRGEWFTCDNDGCSFKRVSEEEVESQYENRGSNEHHP